VQHQRIDSRVSNVGTDREIVDFDTAHDGLQGNPADEGINFDWSPKEDHETPPVAEHVVAVALLE
jgi:hypothetical protein